jgi:acyl-CoA synthetase (AMP-forming)/AMP-acid ligase II
MSTNPQNHFLSLIRPVLNQSPERVVFKAYLGPVEGWGNITRQTFDDHVSASAAYWEKYWSGIGLFPGDVVGVWYVHHTETCTAMFETSPG